MWKTYRYMDANDFRESEEPSLSWGVRKDNLPTDSDAIWGARTILTRDNVDVLFDRQSMCWQSDSGLDELKLVMDREGGGLLGEIRKKGADMYWDPSVDEYQTIIDTPTFKCIGNTYASYGYLYLGAWIKKGKEQ